MEGFGRFRQSVTCPVKKVSIITGFLGSGKTTLLNRLLRHPAMATTAVLINELGDVGVDNLIVDQLDEDVVLLESGCVCCSVRDDLTTSLLSLYDAATSGRLPEFEQVVLETTGIADPASILQLLMSDDQVCERYRVGTVITVVDGCFAAANLDSVPEAARQVLLADRLVISKSDIVGEPAIAALSSKLRELNPTAECCLSLAVDPASLFRSSDRTKETVPPDSVAHGGRFATFQLGWTEAVEWNAIETWIEGLLSARGEDLWRIKGLINIRGEHKALVFQSVQHSVYAPTQLPRWPDDHPRTELTFIARYFSRKAAIRSLRPFARVSVDE